MAQKTTTIPQDELNILRTYFSKMELPQGNINKRIDLAVALYIGFERVFDLIQQSPETDRDVIEEYAINEYQDALADFDFIIDEPYVFDRVTSAVTDILDTTYDRIENDSEHAFDKSRLQTIAETETNVMFNWSELEEAKSSGKTEKTWQTMRDERVRYDHYLTEGQTVPIDEPFDVNGTPMQFPCDPSAPSEQIINCRCSMKFS